MKEFYWYVVLYKDDKVLPIPFKTFEAAEDYALRFNFKAYFIIK